MRQKGVVLCAVALLALSARAQTVTSTIVGTLTDPAGAVVPGAQVELADQATGAVRSTESTSVGLLRLTNLPPGAYTISIKARGFKSYVQKELNLASSETRDLGRIVLELGTLVEQVSVTAEATPVQTASSEKSALVDSKQLSTIALRGRDMFDFMRLIPGVVDTSTTARDSTGPNPMSGIRVNAGGDVNFTVDGITNDDTTGPNVHYEPNLDSIAEIRVLTSNYQAEFGRNSAGAISVVTKGGGQQFHGTGWWTKRHEQWAAMNFFDNRNRTPKRPYRFDILGFTVGGPVFIPGKWNTDKRRLFFFVSQEYTRRRLQPTTGYWKMPTELERAGDFSKSTDDNGASFTVRDPSTGQVFAGNKIPADRINKTGLSMLNFFPLPNGYVDPAAPYRYNYSHTASGRLPRRNDMFRFDVYATSKLTGYLRFTRDVHDEYIAGTYEVYSPSAKAYVNPEQYHPNPGRGWSVGVNYTVSPSLVNEFTWGTSWNKWNFYWVNEDQFERSRMNNVARLGPAQGTDPRWFANNVPAVSFNGTKLSNGAVYGTSQSPALGVNWVPPFENLNQIWSFSDTLTKTTGKHTLKAGVYYERTEKVEATRTGAHYYGQYNFGSAADMPNDTGYGYSNALIGTFQTYAEGIRNISDLWMPDLEFFVQDNWKLTSRLTLDLGLRFYQLPSASSVNGPMAVFYPPAYSSGKAQRLWYPAVVGGRNVALDRATGATTYTVLSGTLVQNVGEYGNGMVKGGAHPDVPESLFTTRWLYPAPRIGWAWDVFGNGKTAIRGGVGRFFNRFGSGSFQAYTTNPPMGKVPTLLYANIDQLADALQSIAPPSVNSIVGKKDQMETTLNMSFGVQQNVGFGAVADISYVGAFRRHTNYNTDLNRIPMFAQLDPANANPQRPTTALAEVYLRSVSGYGALNFQQFAGSANYNSLQVGVRRAFTRGFAFGLAYTFSKLRLVSGDTWFFDARSRTASVSGPYQVLSINYMYELPELGRRLRNRALGAVVDDWSLSGITQIQSGNTLTPTFSYTTSVNQTSSPGADATARVNVLGDPALAKSERTFGRQFKPEMFAAPVPCSAASKTIACFGNGGQGYLQGPGWANFDVTLAKQIPLRLGEGRSLQFRSEFYNVFNHTQFNGMDTTAQYNLADPTRNVRATFGQLTSARPARVISFSLRLQL